MTDDEPLASSAIELEPSATDSPAPTLLRSSVEKPIELVFGLVGPIGVDLELIATTLEMLLKMVKYEARQIRLSRLILGNSNKDTDSLNQYEISNMLISEGDELCRRTGQQDIVGRLGLAAIRNCRKEITGDPNEPHAEARVAYIVRSFKRKEEVELYRNVYGKAFTLISVYASRAVRIQALAKRFMACIPTAGDKARTPEELAVRLIDRDYKEEEENFGQRVGKTFPMADFFVSNGPRQQLEKQLVRLVRLTLGDPYISPSKEEQGMFFAQAAALRSLDLSRQVGAAIANTDGDILSTGCNDVAKFGGGLYWADDENCVRDYELGFDSNVKIKAELVEDTLRALRKKGLLQLDSAATDSQLADDLLFSDEAFLADSKLYDVIEFGRAVHAEMDAISQAARIGVSLNRSRLFCTTFPCHMCAKHILAAGISEVIFIEPYEKSRTFELFADSISVEAKDAIDGKANFRPFVGVAPRRYIDLFQMTSARKNKNGSILDLNADKLRPKFKRVVFAYIGAEVLFTDELTQLLSKEKP